MDRPNILLVTADQWRADALGCAGHPLVQTPALDALAAEGAHFRRHYTQASPCGPARASLLTGLYLMNHRSVANGAPLDRRHANLATEARAAGYRPVLFGYTDTTADPRGRPAADPDLATYEGVLPGFEAACHLTEDGAAWRAWLLRQGYPAEATAYPAVYAPRPDRVDAPERFGPTYPPTLYPAEHSDTSFLTDRAIDWLGVNRDASPWLLHLSYLRPHPPWAAPAPYNAMYAAEDMAPPIAANRSADDLAAEHPLTRWLIAHETRKAFFPDDHASPVAGASPRDVAQARATYCGLVSEVDANLARVFDALKAAGQWRNTIVVFTSDHGEQLGDRRRFGKRGHHDEAFHVPLIVKPAGDPAPRTVEAFTEAVDVAPTLLAAIGRAPPVAMDGRDLAPWLGGETPARWRDAVMWEYDFRELGSEALAALGVAPDQASLAVWRDARWKYVAFAGLPPLLFDLESDPNCLQDRAADPACAAVRLAAAEALLAHRMTHADRTLANMTAGPGGVTAWRGPRYA